MLVYGFRCRSVIQWASNRALTIVDNFSRECLAIPVAHSIKGEDVVMTMNAIKQFAKRVPQRIQVDNGSEFISKVLDKWAYENDMILDFSRPVPRSQLYVLESGHSIASDQPELLQSILVNHINNK